MLAIAGRFGLDIACVQVPSDTRSDIRLRFFVPDHEMGVSGHATIAAITVVRALGLIAGDDIKVETASGIFSVTFDQDRVRLEQRPPTFGKIVNARLAAVALSLPESAIARTLPVQVVSASRAKLLVPLADESLLDALSPNFDRLWELCERENVTGLYPFVLMPAKTAADAEARQFPLRAGFAEDAATGVAAAALGGYLAAYTRANSAKTHVFRIAQGFAMGAPSLIEAIARCDGVRVVATAVRGKAEILREEEVEL
jgi:PhzF family phenazine biosynthesis protein